MWPAQLYNAILQPWDRLPTGWEMLVVSAGTGILLLLLYRYTSNQEKIRWIRQQLQAHLLEIVLYRREPALIWQAEKNLLVDNLVYLRYALVPLGIALLLLTPLFGQLNLRFGYRGFMPEEPALVSVQLPRSERENSPDVKLTVPPGVRVEAEVVVPSLREVSWRVRGQKEGRYVLAVVAGGQRWAKELVVGEVSRRVSPQRGKNHFWNRMFHAGEPDLPAQAGVETITIRYPMRAWTFGPWGMPWEIGFLIISMLVALALKSRLGVQF